MFVFYIVGLYLLCGYGMLFRYDRLGDALHCVSMDVMQCIV